MTDATIHVHSCPGCDKPMPRACTCLEPGAPRFCYNRIPADRTNDCPNYYVSEQAKAEDGNLTQVMKRQYIADLAAKAEAAPPEQPILKAVRLGLLILGTTHDETARTNHDRLMCVPCQAAAELRTMRANWEGK